MTLKWKRLVHNQFIWTLLTISLLSACGGSGGSAFVAVLEIVTPLGGSWAVVAKPNEELVFDSNLDAPALFTSQLNVNLELTTGEAICGGPAANIPLVGTLINGDLVLRRKDPPNNNSTCMEGTFTDLITLEAGSPGQATQPYENDRVDVQMNLGLWVSTGGGNLKVKFIEPFSVDNDDSFRVAGCVVSANPTDKFDSDDINNPSTEMEGFDTGTRVKPRIVEIKSILTGLTLFTQIVFQDGATLTLLDAQGNSVTLHREQDNTTTCP